jgi:hypothetical protein
MPHYIVKITTTLTNTEEVEVEAPSAQEAGAKVWSQFDEEHDEEYDEAEVIVRDPAQPYWEGENYEPE